MQGQGPGIDVDARAGDAVVAAAEKQQRFGRRIGRAEIHDTAEEDQVVATVVAGMFFLTMWLIVPR